MPDTHYYLQSGFSMETPEETNYLQIQMMCKAVTFVVIDLQNLKRIKFSGDIDLKTVDWLETVRGSIIVILRREIRSGFLFQHFMEHWNRLKVFIFVFSPKKNHCVVKSLWTICMAYPPSLDFFLH